MRLLVLGGTKFLGRHLVETALARGHEVTLLNRGETNPDLFPEAEKLRGDRDGGLDPLHGRIWDAVVDTSGYVPRVVRASTELLAGAVEHYTFVSSISVYADFSEPGIDEERPVATLEDPSTEDFGGEAYGALKAACERVLTEVFGERALNVRPGLIVGAHDPTGRFAYWPHRVARGGEVLAPGPPERRVQLIDARDLGEWILRMAESGRTGVYNATHPGVEMGQLLEECRAVSSDAQLVWVTDELLVEHGVGEWMELPLWIADPAWRGMLAADVSKAIAAGLTFRPLAETIADTLAEAASVDGVGLSPERERELLEAWRRRR